MTARKILTQVSGKGSLFNFLFFLFLMMAAVPILFLFFSSLFTMNLPGIVLALVLGAILVNDFKKKDLFILSRDIIILNTTLWFLLGLLSIVKQLFPTMPAFVTYLLLIPYAALSGFMAFTLLKKAEPHNNRKRLLRAAVAISSIIAVVSAINGALLSTLELFTTTLQDKVSISLLDTIVLSLHNPHIAFLIVLVLFNLPFLKHYLQGKNRRQLLLYLFPVGVYLILTGLWAVFKHLLLAVA